MFKTLALLFAAAPTLAVEVSTSPAAALSTPPAAVEPSTGPAAAAPPPPPAVVVSTPPPTVSIVWPKTGAAYPFVRRSFTFGSVTPGASLTVNGKPVVPHPKGGFLAMVDFSTGAFTLNYEATYLGAVGVASRTVPVAAAFEDLPSTSPVAVVDPLEDLELIPGDVAVLRVKGPPGAEAAFRIKDLAKDLPLFEQSAGLYEGRYRVTPDDDGKDHQVSFQLKDKAGKRWKADAPGRLSVRDPQRFQVAVSTARLTIVKTGVQGYGWFYPPGVRFIVQGRKGGAWRVRFTPELEGWVDSTSVALLPPGTPAPVGQVGKYLRTEVLPDLVRLSVDVEHPFPFEVRQTVEPLGFEVRLFGGMQRLDRFRFHPDDAVVKNVRWRQEATRVTLLEVDTRLDWGWGYDAYYDKGRFVLDIRRPPDLTGRKSVLAGRRIVVDPGHSPDHGALGPLGTEEQHHNLTLGLRLRDLLVKEGAEVYMTRTSTGPLPLMDRPFMAWAARGDLLVSVHNNAVAVTDDPLESPRGFMTFYGLPQSRPLAEAVHGAYKRLVKQLPDEALRWGDLHLCRFPQMPSILTESAYVMLPEQEAMLLDPMHQDRFARAMLEGIRDFYEAYKKVQSKSDWEKKAARR